MKTFAIYGDNIVECERTITLLKRSLKAEYCHVQGTAVAPTYFMDTKSDKYQFHTYPGFDRWKYDIVSAIKKAGGILRETPDVFITAVELGMEKPILAIEFCSALPAGNQAWQRNGRAYSTSRSGVPYLIVTEIGGYELDTMRRKKAPRLPNPVVPFSYISYAISSCHEVMIAYEMNPGADRDNKNRYAKMMADDELLRYIASKFIVSGPTDMFASMMNKAFLFVNTASNKRRRNTSSLNNEQWNTVFHSLLHDKDSSAIYREFNINWRKKLSIETKKTFKRFLSTVETFATAIGSRDLPFCIVRKEFSSELRASIKLEYPKFYTLIPESQFAQSDIAICWINGFKPRGDDARPDRGLLPLLRMIVGDKMTILTVVYGPAPQSAISKLTNSPKRLADDNGLWEVILELSNYIICDSMQADDYVCQYGRGNYLSQKQPNKQIFIKENNIHFPLHDRIGENDVDSVIHMLFAYVLNYRCFESMCNPPGGDWSGISLMLRNKEYRWLSLPKVSASGSKRPDHIIQVDDNLIITIESKDCLGNLEEDIGHRLNQYCKDLLLSLPSCVRESHGEWSDIINEYKVQEFEFFSIGAFLETSNNDANIAITQAKTDAIFLISFEDETAIIKMRFKAGCNQIIKSLLTNIAIPKNLKIKVEQV